MQSTKTWGSEVDSYLTQHILVILCAEIEQEFHCVLESRVNKAHDTELKNFALATGKKVLRSIGKSEIAGFVAHFGIEAKEYLNNNVNEREITLYNNAVSCRHNVAHSTGSNITFRELGDILSAAKNFIDVFEKAISLNRNAP
jgi:hypothetical protein